MSRGDEVRAVAGGLRLRLAGVVLAVLGALGATATGCAGDERLAPAGEGGGGAGGVTASTGSGGAPPQPPEQPPSPVREVLQRNPFGNVAETGNLLWDGDFEWQSAFADQYGWIEGFSYGVRRPVVGAACRSGLKCAQLGSNASMVGIGMASADADLYVSAWTRPEGAPCTSMEVALFADGLDDDAVDAPIPPVSDDPDADGWCHHEGVVPQRNDKSYVFIRQTRPGGLATVDDVVVRRVTPEEALSVPRIAAPVPAADMVARLDDARRVVRSLRGPREGAPDPLRRALERQSRSDARPTLRLAAPRPARRGAP